MGSFKPSNTIDTGHRNYFHYAEPRIPTVRESARIQSFPDSFEIIGTRGSQYKEVGNAVPPMLANIIATELKKRIQ
jgi:DNA (cytosine-5)-methyltransferase 1